MNAEHAATENSVQSKKQPDKTKSKEMSEGKKTLRLINLTAERERDQILKT